VKQTIAEDIVRIREAVQGMISEALLKREAKKKKAAEVSSDGGGFAGSGVEGGSASKAKSESEKMERLVKTMEENYRRELVELQKKTQEQELEIEARLEKEAELKKKTEEEVR
jgi:phosphoglycerate-specific signal transduction histidine kinase